ncbi:Coa6 protein [Martiniozyma asiatica (nom. inval.)]|nr:Coa6 protein [Martiniozyma asiatica]
MWFSSTEAPAPPKRSSREKCWESRDLFFSCLDKIEINNPLDPSKSSIIQKECGSQDKQFQKDCVASWVKYFKEKRPFDLKKERMLKEAAEQGSEIVQMDGYRK